VLHVPQDSVAFNASISDHVRSSAADLTDAEIATLLESVGLAHLRDLPGGLDEPLGPTGAALTPSERQRLSLAMALAARPRALLIGPLIALADADTAMPILATLRSADVGTVLIAVRSPEVAAVLDLMAFVTADDFAVGTHDQLLIDVADYSRIWGQRLLGDEVDLSVLGLGDTAQESLHARLVTERYTPGEVIYREGAVADRIVFVISGHVEVTTLDADGRPRRVAVLGPGNHCGDLRLTVGERRAESAHALDNCVVRTLSREAISAGMTGLLDRTATERRIVASILRTGPATTADLRDRLPDIPHPEVAKALALLVQDGAVRESDGQLSVVLTRGAKTGARDLLDRLGDL
jgi:hypothetical protein